METRSAVDPPVAKPITAQFGDEKCCGPSSGKTNYGSVWRREMLWTLQWPSQLRHSLETRSAVDPPVAKLITAQFGDEKCCGPSSGKTNYGTVWRREMLWTLQWPSQLRHSLKTRSAVDPPVAKLITAQFGDEKYYGPSSSQTNYGTVWRREVLWTLQWPNPLRHKERLNNHW